MYPLRVCFIPCFSKFFFFKKTIFIPITELSLSLHSYPGIFDHLWFLFRYSNSGCFRSDRKLVLVWHPPEIQESFYERQELNDVCEGMQLSFSGHDETELTEPWGAQHDHAGVLWLCTELAFSRVSLYWSVDIPVWKQTVNTHAQIF